MIYLSVAGQQLVKMYFWYGQAWVQWNLSRQPNQNQILKADENQGRQLNNRFDSTPGYGNLCGEDGGALDGLD
jgi:hypothetical protein